MTIKDVARESNVSVATVSRVLNGTGPVNDATRDRILEVAGRLRYVPNGAARSLITSRTNTLGVLLPDLYGEFFSEIIRGIDQAARAQGYHLLVSSSHADRAEVAAALQAMRGRVDGLILMSPDMDAAAVEDALPAGSPAVLLNAPEAHGFDALSVDNFGGARSMVRHLVHLGHRRVAHVTGAERNHDAGERRRGYRAALRDSGLPADPSLELAGDFSDGAGYDAGRALLALRDRPTAVFAANDAMAIGLMGALREAGVRVPEDVAVAGFDDIPVARYVTPPLSTMRVDITAFAGRATAALLGAVSEGADHVTRRETVPVELVVRQSCGAASRAGSGERGARAVRGAAAGKSGRRRNTAAASDAAAAHSKRRPV